VRSHSIYGKDIKTLQPRTWLNDTVVNAYIDLICKEEASDAAYFNSFFYSKLGRKSEATALTRWTKKKNIFKNRWLIIPVFLSAHWTLILVDHTMRKVQYYDSYHNCVENFYYAFDCWLRQEWARQNKGEYTSYEKDRVLVMQLSFHFWTMYSI